MVIDKLGR